MLSDFRATLRSLRRAPWHTLGVVLILALGLGVNLALGTIAQRLILRPFDGPAPERMVTVVRRHDSDPRSLSPYEYLSLKAQMKRLTHVTAIAGRSVLLDQGGQVERTWSMRVSADAFPLMGLPAHFSPEDDRAGGPPRVVVTHRFWRSHLGADPQAVGGNLRLNGVDHQIVGVLPFRFRPPSCLSGAPLYVPLALTSAEVEARKASFLNLVGRLAPGATREAAEAEVRQRCDQLEREVHHYQETTTTLPLQLEVQVPLRRVKLALTLVCGCFILLIACANVANLLLARWLPRRRELGLRVALGAGHLALLRPMAMEAFVLAFAGGSLATLLLIQTQGTLTKLLGPALPPLLGTQAGTTFGLALVLTSAAGVMLSAPLYLALRRLDPAKSVRDSTRGTGSHGHGRLRTVLVVTQVATATALLGTSLLLVRNLRNLNGVELGFNAKGVLTCAVQLPAAGYPTEAARLAFQQALLARVEALPGVTRAGLIDELPMKDSSSSYAYDVPGEPSPARSRSTLVHAVLGDYFGALEIPLVKGRTPGATERDACVVNERLATLAWGGKDPLGRMLHVYDKDYRVVGVVRDARHERLLAPVQEQLYAPFRASPQTNFYITLRTQGTPSALIDPLKAQIRAMDSSLPLDELVPMTQLLREQTREWESVSWVFNGLAALAITLAVLGLGGALSLMVVQRRAEIGVRMALGARVGHIVGLVLGQGMRQILLGLLLGLPAAFGLGSLLRGQLYGMTPSDPRTALVVMVLLAFVGLLACLIPALRAARVQPAEALRAE